MFAFGTGLFAKLDSSVLRDTFVAGGKAMRSATDYRRFARQSRRLAAALRKPADKRALELMAKGWDKAAEKREAMQNSKEQNNQKQQEHLAEADRD